MVQRCESEGIVALDGIHRFEQHGFSHWDKAVFEPFVAGRSRDPRTDGNERTGAHQPGGPRWAREHSVRTRDAGRRRGQELIDGVDGKPSESLVPHDHVQLREEATPVRRHRQ